MAKKKEQQLVVNQVIVRPANRQAVDVGKWRTALQAADYGRTTQLYNLYEDILLDGVLADAIDKRIRAVTGAEITFQNAEGEENDEMISLIDSEEFEYLLQEVMQGFFWGVSLIELNFDVQKGMEVYSVPRKHIRPDTKRIALQENDPDGTLSYEELPGMIEVRNRKDRFGIILRACPYAIFKRGGFSDWAQMVEVFGMPKRVGKYSIYDVEARKQLEEAFNSQGAAATLIVPKETEINTEPGGGNTSSALYSDFIDACDRQLLISILSQTMTTMDGSSRSQSETHKEVEEQVNKHDLRAVQRVLNVQLKPILEARGYPVKGGSFVFPKALENLTIEQLISLSDIIDIPAYYIQERFGIPQAEDTDRIAMKRQTELPPVEKKPKESLTDSERNGLLKLFDRFFAYAPTMRSGAKSKRNWISSITDTAINLADRVILGVNINKLFTRALEEIYREQGGELVDRSLFEITNTALQKGVDKSFKNAGAEFGRKNQAFIEEFKKNTAVFSAFKAHREGNDIAAMLLDENGDLRSFHEFKKVVLGSSIDRDYNRNWLRTEYNMAVRAARSAAYYRECLETAHIYPNLEYLESSAANKRGDHLEYVGTVLPIEHPWWDTHMPPSAWGCECGVRKTDKPVTPVPQGGKPINPVFNNNPGKTAEFINTAEHPYVKSAEQLHEDIYDITSVILTEAEKAAKEFKRVIASRERTKKWMEKKIPAGKPVKIQVDVKHLKEITLTRTVVKTIVAKGHDNAVERNRAVTNLKKLIKEGKYYGWAEDEIIDGVQKHNDVNYWLYYETRVGTVCIKRTKSGDNKPYAILDEKGLKEIDQHIKKEDPIR